MQFDPNIPLDLTNIDVTLANGEVMALHTPTVFERIATMLQFLADFLSAFMNVAIVGGIVLLVMVLIAMHIDRRSAIDHRMGHR